MMVRAVMMIKTSNDGKGSKSSNDGKLLMVKMAMMVRAVD